MVEFKNISPKPIEARFTGSSLNANPLLIAK